MKFNISKKELDQIIKEEAIKLKSEQILKEEKYQKKLRLLESRMNSINQEIEDLYPKQQLDEATASFLGLDEEEQVDEIFGMGKFSKAKKLFKQMKSDQFNKLMQAYKSRSPEYITLSKQMVNEIPALTNQIAAQVGITDRSDLNTLRKSLMDMVQPMDYGTFKAQAKKGGASFADIARGSSSLASGK